MSRWGGFFQFPPTLVNFQSDSQYVMKLHFRQGYNETETLCAHSSFIEIKKNTRRLQIEFSLGVHDFLDDFLGHDLFPG